ncbi:S-adenosyl-L-methionine-dependent methyltransferase [Cyathus striatus]|nr:S-adenosyl-L-methionine-dependent methyltransferase [Cyathus striatus]
MSVPSVSYLKQLVNVINTHVDIIENHALKSGVAHPTIEDLYDPLSPNEQFTMEIEVMQAALLAASAATQLAATLKLPGLSLYEKSNAFHIPAALGIASDACAVELLREAGPEGMDVAEISARTGTDANLLGRALRLLATHYIFREVKPNIFTNNRLSSMMDTGKSSEALVALTKYVNYPVVRRVHGEKYKGTNGIAAFVDTAVDLNFKAAAFMPDMFINITGVDTAFKAAFRDGNMWDYQEKRPGYVERFQSYMHGRTSIQPPNSNTDGLDLSSVPAGGIVIDVGGGSGAITFELARNAPHLSFIVQDRTQTIRDNTIPFWSEDLERIEMISTGRVKLQEQNFFEPQPASSSRAAAFFLRFILHDWPHADCVKILTHLRNCASANARLIIVDQLIPYACPADDMPGVETHGFSIPPAPKPLLANLGEANPNVYRTDFIMYSTVNGQERTLAEFDALMKESGWKVEQVFRTMGTAISRIICKVA